MQKDFPDKTVERKKSDTKKCVWYTTIYVNGGIKIYLSIHLCMQKESRRIQKRLIIALAVHCGRRVWGHWIDEGYGRREVLLSKSFYAF